MRLDDIRQEQALYIRRRACLSRAVRAALLLVLAAALCAANALGNRYFEVTVYQMQSSRVREGFRIALLSDLHNQEYGAGNYGLIEAVRQARPDLILLAGDMVNQDEEDLHVVLDLCGGLKRIAPVFYILGNHEGVPLYEKGGGDGGEALDTQLIQLGIPVLYSGCEELVIHGNPVTLGVFPWPASQAEELDPAEVQRLEGGSGFRIMASHYPSIFYETLFDADAELAVAGHYHGGQVRLPFVGGLYHVDDGLFPRYSGGQYALGRAQLVVSRGLGGHTWVPRVNNRPELVMIDVLPSGKEG